MAECCARGGALFGIYCFQEKGLKARHVGNPNGMKTKYAQILKILVIATSFGGVALGLLMAWEEGYSEAWRRLLYFTAQSNLWLGITLFLSLFRFARATSRRVALFSLLQYVFTVSILLTGLVFCLILDPYAPPDYSPWTASNLLTHACTPVLALFLYAFSPRHFQFNPKTVCVTLLPPLFYLGFVAVLTHFAVEFGRGRPAPYFFMDFRSPRAIFGLSGTPPQAVGSFYWIVLLCLIVLLLAELLARYPKRQ